MFHHLNFRVDYGYGNYQALNIREKDREILRRLAFKVKQIAEMPEQKHKQVLWKNHNQLKGNRPLILCDPENGWNEIITDDFIKCENNLARHWECWLRKEIFWGEEMGDDKTVEAIFEVPLVYHERPWGIDDGSGFRTGIHGGYREDGGAYELGEILENYDLLEHIVEPQITIDQDRSTKVLEVAQDIFGDILDVRQKTVWFWSVGLTDDVVNLRGMERLMFDFFDHPDEIHRLMGLIQKGVMNNLDFLEHNNLLGMNNDSTYVGSGGIGWTDELTHIHELNSVMLKDMWGLSESQMTVGISPDMFKEFIFPYQKPIMERFGLSCYGCCEAMDHRIDIVRQVKNLRRISVSAWADVTLMSEKLKKDYVLSLKPTPSHLAVAQIDENVIRKDIRNKLKMTKDNHVELIMKDNHTLGGNPRNIVRWAQIAREEIESI